MAVRNLLVVQEDIPLPANQPLGKRLQSLSSDPRGLQIIPAAATIQAVQQRLDQQEETRMVRKMDDVNDSVVSQLCKVNDYMVI